MFVADLAFSLIESVLIFLFTGLLQIPLTLLSQAFGAA
jgi:hypothetical protein